MTAPKPYVLVPLVATEEMIADGVEGSKDSMGNMDQSFGFTPYLIPGCWQAMLAARPASYIALEAAWSLLSDAFTHADQEDWDYLFSILRQKLGGRASFWKVVLSECHTALTALAEAEAAVTRKWCDGCGRDWADPPSSLCPVCQAYMGHQI